jgi:VWFA-related protein
VRSLILALSLVSVAGALDWPHSQASPSQDRSRFTTSTTAISVDVVVRDKHGKPVFDLTRDDFEVLEDDVQQEVTSFVAPKPLPLQTPAAASAAPSTPTPIADSGGSRPPADASLIAFVFGRLSGQGRTLAMKAADAYMSARTDPLDLAGIFSLDAALTQLCDFTSDEATLRRALKLAATRATSGPGHQGEGGISSAEFHGPLFMGRRSEFSGEMGGAVLELEDENLAHATMMRLIELMKALRPLPGRKSVVYFAEAMSIFWQDEPYFQSLIDLANRSNVTMYTVDAAGLRTHSGDFAMGGQLAANARTMFDGGGSGLSPEEIFAMTRSANVPSVLTALSTATGGFTIADTNDLAARFHLINEDRRVYYLLSYTPKNADFHGEYRRIAVRVKRPDVAVRARPGYLAVANSDPTRIPLAFEAPAIAALNQSAPPHDLPLQLAAFVFPLPDGSTATPIVVRVPAGALTFTKTPDGFRAGATVLARIHDADGALIKSGSQPYRLTGTEAQEQIAHTTQLTFLRQPTLPPGRYSVEAAVTDAAGTRAGVARVDLAVPETRKDTLRVSSLVFVSEARPLPSEAHDSPFAFGDKILVPAPSNVVSRSTTAAATYFLSLIPATGGEPHASLDLLRNGGVIGSTPLTIAQRDSSGRIQQAGKLPIGQLAPGSYVARVTVTQGTATEIRELAFVVE